MVETRVRRTGRRGGRETSPPPPGSKGFAPASRSRIPGREEIVDRLGSMTDRQDLERLFDRHVGISALVRLMGREVSRRDIGDLLESPHPEREIRKFLR